ncbi:MAG: hypothetical protein ACYCZJ_14720 [Sulfuriferula sp.]
MATRDALSAKEASCNSPEDWAALAQEALMEPADAEYAKKLVDDIAGDCQFTKDLVAIATVYKALGDDTQAAELMQQAEDYCMSGEEQIALAEGKFKVLNDKAGAVTAYEQALKEIANVAPLLELAKTMLAVIGDKEFAKKIYAKAEAKAETVAARAAEYVKLAQAAAADLGDAGYLGELYERAAAKLSTPADLLLLANSMNDPARAKPLYTKVLESSGDVQSLAKLLEAAQAAKDEGFVKLILEKMAGLATTTPELLSLTDGFMAVGDKANASKTLDAAEDKVTSADEMQKVVDATARHFAEDSPRLERGKQKLEKRIANQARYVEFQTLENALSSVKATLHLAERVAVELADPFYAAKLLDRAEKMLAEEPFQFSRTQPLIVAVDKHTDDTAWLTRLLDESAAKTTDFIWFKEVAHTAAHLSHHPELGLEKARAYLKDWEARLKACNASVYDFTKLAQAVIADLGDTVWGTALLNDARASAKDHYALAHIGHLTALVGDAAGAEALYLQAAAKCITGDAALQLVDRLKSYELSEAQLRKIYEACGQAQVTPADKLRWVEGITECFRDKAWAAQAYSEIDGQFTGADKIRFHQSRMSRVGDEFYPYRRHAA